MGAATLVSLIPTMILERKPGMTPGAFFMPAAKENDFELLTIPDCKYFIYLDGDRGSIAAYKAGEEVAASIVRDYIDSKFSVAPEYHPGIGWVPGEYEMQERDEKTGLFGAKGYDKVRFKTEHQDVLDTLNKLQNLWFAEIVKIADDAWERHHAHRAISDEQRLAAKRRNLFACHVSDAFS